MNAKMEVLTESQAKILDRIDAQLEAMADTVTKYEIGIAGDDTMDVRTGYDYERLRNILDVCKEEHDWEEFEPFLFSGTCVVTDPWDDPTGVAVLDEQIASLHKLHKEFCTFFNLNIYV